jgi:hypothetical protein
MDTGEPPPDEEPGLFGCASGAGAGSLLLGWLGSLALTRKRWR